MLSETEVRTRYEGAVANAAIADGPTYDILYGKAQAYGAVLGYSWEKAETDINAEIERLLTGDFHEAHKA